MFYEINILFILFYFKHTVFASAINACSECASVKRYKSIMHPILPLCFFIIYYNFLLGKLFLFNL